MLPCNCLFPSLTCCPSSPPSCRCCRQCYSLPWPQPASATACTQAKPPATAEPSRRCHISGAPPPLPAAATRPSRPQPARRGSSSTAAAAAPPPVEQENKHDVTRRQPPLGWSKPPLSERRAGAATSGKRSEHRQHVRAQPSSSDRPAAVSPAGRAGGRRRGASPSAQVQGRPASPVAAAASLLLAGAGVPAPTMQAHAVPSHFGHSVCCRRGGAHENIEGGSREVGGRAGAHKWNSPLARTALAKRVRPRGATLLRAGKPAAGAGELPRAPAPASCPTMPPPPRALRWRRPSLRRSSPRLLGPGDCPQRLGSRQACATLTSTTYRPDACK